MPGDATGDEIGTPPLVRAAPRSESPLHVAPERDKTTLPTSTDPQPAAGTEPTERTTHD